MFKKLAFIFAFVLSLSLSGFGLALAQEEPPNAPLHGGRPGLGQITALGEGQFTVQSRRGEEHILLVDELTQYRDTNGEVLTFEDLQVGQWVAGFVRFNAQGQAVARLVIIFPEDFDPSQRLGRHARGRVTNVDISAGNLTLQTREGDKVTFRTAEGTIYLGAVADLAQIRQGMLVAVTGIDQEEGFPLALVVYIRPPLQKYHGTVTAVDVGASTFTIQTRAGEQLVIEVSENTRYRSWGNWLHELSDLKPGVHLLAGVDEIEEGVYLARLVLAGKSPLP